VPGVSIMAKKYFGTILSVHLDNLLDIVTSMQWFNRGPKKGIAMTVPTRLFANDKHIIGSFCPHQNGILAQDDNDHDSSIITTFSKIVSF
jgi:hypothetical protein